MHRDNTQTRPISGGSISGWIVHKARCTLLGIPRWLAVTTLYALLIGAYVYPALLSGIGGWEMGPNIVQDGLRALVVVQIARSFTLRWTEFVPAQRLYWMAMATGIVLNLSRGHFAGTPLTVSFFLLHMGMVGLTWRLMNTPAREVALQKQITALKAIHAQELVDCRREHAEEKVANIAQLDDLLTENEVLDEKCRRLIDELEIANLRVKHLESQMPTVPPTDPDEQKGGP